jgi:hypothetical protein
MEEPSTFAEAKQSTAWKKAMQAELDSIEENGTWELSKLPAGQRAIGIKWVYNLKKDLSGNVVKYKERLVAKGHVQRQNLDFDEVFAPVARLETVRLLIAIAAQEG